MSRKIVVKKCSDCPFVQLYFCALKDEDKASDHYFCDGDGHTSYVAELVEENNIPDWCPLKVDESGE